MTKQIPNPPNPQSEHSKAENEVLSFLRSGNCDSVTIKFKNGKMDTLHIEETVDVSEKIAFLLRTHNFQKVEVVLTAGKITHIKRKLTRKLNVC